MRVKIVFAFAILGIINGSSISDKYQETNPYNGNCTNCNNGNCTEPAGNKSYNTYSINIVKIGFWKVIL